MSTPSNPCPKESKRKAAERGRHANITYISHSFGMEPKWTRKSKKDGTGKDVKRNPFFWELASEWKQLAIGNFPQSYPSSRMTYY